MDLQFGGERTDGRKWLSGLKFSTDDGLLRREDNLIENGFAGPKVKMERCHSHNVTHDAGCVKSRLKGGCSQDWLPHITLETMATLGLIEYADASTEVRAVYDDIMATRQTDWINNFWKALAHDPATLRRTWESIKQIMAPGALDAVTKEMIYLAVSASNQCPYCIASHTAGARKAGMSDAMFAEVMAVVGMANETNRLSSGYQVEIDERFKT